LIGDFVEPLIVRPQRHPWGKPGGGEKVGIDIADAASEQCMRDAGAPSWQGYSNTEGGNDLFT
jgi:hypothetical protein